MKTLNMQDEILGLDKMDSEQWKQAFKAEVANNKKARKTEKNKIKKEDYCIDESYIDPAIWP